MRKAAELGLMLVCPGVFCVWFLLKTTPLQQPLTLGCRHEPAWSGPSGRRRELGLWQGRGFLRRRDRGALERPLQHVFLRHGRAPRSHRDGMRFPPKQHRHPPTYTWLWKHFPAADAERRGVMGHSMGGHGALVCALRNPGFYRSCSAFAPICHPSLCPWGQKAFAGYLGLQGPAWAVRIGSGRTKFVGFNSGFLAELRCH
jgi:hypothetical protein